MKKSFYVILSSLALAFFTVSILTNLKGELGVIGLFPGWWLDWATEQFLIMVFDEPYFTLDNVSAFFNLEFWGESGKQFIILVAKNLSIIFNFIFYLFIYFFISYPLSFVLTKQYNSKRVIL